MIIEFLYFDECPSWKNALEILEEALRELELEADVTQLQVETPEEANQHQFIGSPSIRLNGVDLFPSDQDHYALGCRVYPTPEGFKGWPTVEMVKEKLLARATIG